MHVLHIKGMNQNLGTGVPGRILLKKFGLMYSVGFKVGQILLQEIYSDAFRRIILEILLMVNYEQCNDVLKNGGRLWLRSLCIPAWMQILNVIKSFL